MPTKVLIGQFAGVLRWMGPAVLLIAGVTWFAGRAPGGSLTLLGYWGIAVLISCLVGILVSVIRPTKLTLRSDGFAWQAQLGTLAASWDDVEAIALVSGSSHFGSKMGFRFRSGSRAANQRASELNRSVTGYDRSIPNVWEMPTDDLVHVLNEYLLASRSPTARP